MEQLEQIPIGQQANDGAGDPLRSGMAKVNANFVKVQTGVDAVELTAANAAQTATEAKTTADAAIPAAQKGMAGGVAPLDATGKVPATHLPELADYIPVEEKGAAGGVAPLDAQGKVPAENLPSAEDSIPLTQKGAAGGVATLDAAAQVPAAQLGNAVKATEKAAAGGVATLDAGGKVPAAQLPPIPTGPPAGSVAWWPLRTSIPAGQIPADGQTVSRATFPDLAAMVTGGKVPVVTEADWLADPLKRGSYTVGDGSTTIRLPDLNGQASGSLGAVFQRGDGARSSGVNGIIQADQLGPMQYSVAQGYASATNLLINGTGSPVLPSGSSAVGTISGIAQAGDGNKWIRNTGVETRPLAASGVWTIQAFGAVTNPGSADAAQLASDYAALNASLQALDGQISFALLTPNNGNPIAQNSRYVMSNPFPGHLVIAIAEMMFDGGWSETGWFTDNQSGVSRAWGVKAGQDNGGNIIVQTGLNGMNAAATNELGPKFTSGSLKAPVQCRVRVYKIKGATS